MAIFASRIETKIQNEIRRRQRANASPFDDKFSFASRIPFIILESNASKNGSIELASKNILYGGSKDFINFVNNEGLFIKTTDIGLRPRSGITSININNEGRLGSIRKAVVNFQCWSLDELENLQRLYMNPGIYLFLQWGIYERGKETPPIQSIFKFNREEVISPIKYFMGKDVIKNLVLESDGSYDAIVGPCSNFSWKINKEGGFDCSTTIISPANFVYSFLVNDPDIKDNSFFIWTTGIVGNTNETSIASNNNNSDADSIKKQNEANKKALESTFGKDNTSMNTFATSIIENVDNAFNNVEKFFNNGSEYYKYIRLPNEDGIKNLGEELTYISFGHLCTIINNLFFYSKKSDINSVFDELKKSNGKSKSVFSNLKMVHIDLNRNDAICKNHYNLRSFNPKEILIFNEQADSGVIANEKLITYLKNSGLDASYLLFDYKSPSDGMTKPQDYSLGRLKAIYINTSSVSRILQSSREIIEFIDGILDLINSSVDNYFKLIRDNDENDSLAITIKDELLTSNDREVFTFNNYATQTVIKNITLDGNLPSKFQTAAYVGNTNSNSSQRDINQNDAFSRYADGFKDADFRKPEALGTGYIIDDSGELLKMNKEYKEVLKLNLYDTTMISYQKSFFQILKKLSIDTKSYPVGFPVGINLKITIDGISGMYYGNLFNVNYIPKFLQQDVCFQITNVSHEVTQEGWNTTLDSVLRPAYGVNVIE